MNYSKTDYVLEKLMERKCRLERRCLHLQRRISHARKEKLRIVTKRNKCKPDYYQYYLRKDDDDLQGTYLRKEQLGIAQEIAQRDYEADLLVEQQHELAFVERTISRYVADAAEQVLAIQHPGRRCLIRSAVITDEQFVDSWLNRKRKPNPYPEKPGFQTTSQIMVRSKSEMIIADCLHDAGIPFHYEFPFVLKGGVFYPDFYCLIPQTRREFIWEHFGRMDDSDYCEGTIRKIACYQQYLPEDCGFVATFENGVTPFSKGYALAILQRILKKQIPQ